MWKLKFIDLFFLPMFSQMLQDWQPFCLKSTREVSIMRNGTFFKGQSPSLTHNSVFTCNVKTCVVSRKVWKRPNEERVKKKGGLDLFETRIFTKAKAVCWCCPVSVVRAVLPASSACLPVLVFRCPESCSPSEPEILSPTCQSRPLPESGPHQGGQYVFCLCMCVCASSR